MFSATVITGMSMKCWCTIPMPRVDRVLRRAELDRLALDQDLALVRAGRARRGCSSASTCRRRSRRAARAPRPRARSKLTSSFATMPGKRFVMSAQLEDGRARRPSRGDSTVPARPNRAVGTTRGRARGPPSRSIALRDRCYLACGTLILPAAICFETACRASRSRRALRRLGADLAEADAAVLDGEDDVGAALERAVLDAA